MTATDEIVAANSEFAATFSGAHLPVRPARKLAILMCMDARIDPIRALGLQPGDAHIIRNAGGRATGDAIRSLVVSYRLLDTREFAVINHTNCGMTAFTNESLHEQLREDLGVDASNFDFLPFTDLDETVRQDVETIRACPLIPDDIPVRGFVYDVLSGQLREIA